MKQARSHWPCALAPTRSSTCRSSCPVWTGYAARGAASEGHVVLESCSWISCTNQGSSGKSTNPPPAELKYKLPLKAQQSMQFLYIQCVHCSWTFSHCIQQVQDWDIPRHQGNFVALEPSDQICFEEMKMTAGLQQLLTNLETQNVHVTAMTATHISKWNLVLTSVSKLKGTFRLLLSNKLTSILNVGWNFNRNSGRNNSIQFNIVRNCRCKCITSQYTHLNTWYHITSYD